MKTKAEAIELLGMSAVAEVKDEAGEVISPAFDPSKGFNFAGFALSSWMQIPYMLQPRVQFQAVRL